MLLMGLWLLVIKPVFVVKNDWLLRSIPNQAYLSWFMHCGKISLFFLTSMLENLAHHEFFAYMRPPGAQLSAVGPPRDSLSAFFGGLENRPNCIYIEKISHLSN